MLAAVRSALLDPDAGLFGSNIVQIGQAFYDSQIYKACLGVPGVQAVHALTVTVGPPLLRRYVWQILSVWAQGRRLKPATGAGCSGHRYDPGPDGYFTLAAAALQPTGVLGRHERLRRQLRSGLRGQALDVAAGGLPRAQDTNQFNANGPLRELVNRIGAQGAILRRSIDRLWEDQSIETCDDWVIPYIGDLLATNLVASLDARGQRLDVAKTIYYRRRKGTVSILEEIANITGWDAKVVEFFRRLGRTRHGLDPPLGRPLLPSTTRSPSFNCRKDWLVRLPGPQSAGWPICATPRRRPNPAPPSTNTSTPPTRARATGGARLVQHTQFRRVRLAPAGLSAGPVTPVWAPGTNSFTFDPTGRDIPLFALHRGVNAFGDNWVSPQACQIATPISDDLLNANIEASQPGSTDPPPVQLYGDALAVLDSAGDIIPADSTPTQNSGLVVCPTIGRFRISGSPPAWFGSPPAPSAVARYTYGFSSQIGAGSYDRRVAGAAIPTPSPVALLPDGPDALPHRAQFPHRALWRSAAA